MSKRDTLLKSRHETATKLNKRLRKEIRIVPWKDPVELEFVGRGLLSVLEEKSIDRNTSIFEDALYMLDVWNGRFHAAETLPHAIESTAALSQVYWREHVLGGISILELRLSYSSAIVRCINGYADALQQQRFVAAPVSALCGQLGIPSWLVDIRHEASHNSLPTLPVLRLAAVTLLEFLKTEYWIPTCAPYWALSKNDENETNADIVDETVKSCNMIKQEKAIEILIQYKACASKPQLIAPIEEGSKTEKKNHGSVMQKKESSNVNKPFDTFFGDSGGESSDEDEEWEDPLLGSIWGTSIGSSANRFAVLTATKKNKKKEASKTKKPRKPKPPQQRKKLPGEKYPSDYAKDFVESISPIEGYTIANQFLVWGGIAGSPPGRGVLIPGSTTAFPESWKGVRKVWDRYLPLLEVLGRLWPGFCSNLLTNLVNFVLSIEQACIEEQCQDPGSLRKLYFLSSWIRCLVSAEFMQKVYPGEKKQKDKKCTGSNIPLARLDQLLVFQYPLNSLCDLCIIDDQEKDPKWRKTSLDILQTFEEILGERRTQNFGVSMDNQEVDRLNDCGESISGYEKEVDSKAMNAIGHGPALNDNKMSLEEIEALLSDEEEERPEKGDDLKDSTKRATNSISEIRQDSALVAWSKCSHWDACSIGTMPGQLV